MTAHLDGLAVTVEAADPEGAAKLEGVMAWSLDRFGFRQGGLQDRCTRAA